MFEKIRRLRARAQLEAVFGTAEPPTFPALTTRILEVLRRHDASIDEVAEALRWDPALTVKLLATVNSAAYAPRKPIEDVRHAANYMGRTQLEALVIAVACRAALPAEPGRAFDPRRFWLTAAQRAGLARAIAERLHPGRASEAFTAALLLDLAVPVLSKHLGDRYGEALEAWHGGDARDLESLEAEICGRTHTSVGLSLAEHWGLPPAVSANIGAHHRVGTNDQEVLPAIRLVAPVREVPGEDEAERLIESARAEYGLEPDWTVAQIAASREAAVDLSERLAS